MKRAGRTVGVIVALGVSGCAAAKPAVDSSAPDVSLDATVMEASSDAIEERSSDAVSDAVDARVSECGVAEIECFDDGDGDGYARSGAASVRVAGCGPCPAGTTSRAPTGASVDCNDGDPAFSPGVVDRCDNEDNDCDPRTADGAGDPRVGASCPVTGGVGRCGTAATACVMGAIECRRNAARAEMCNGEDDDCDGATDESLCVDSSSAPTGYGVCASASECRLGACVEGRGDCDTSRANGCEADLRSDPSHCGACGVTCGPRGCVDGVCVDRRPSMLTSRAHAVCAIFEGGAFRCRGGLVTPYSGLAVDWMNSTTWTGAVSSDHGAYATVVTLANGRVRGFGSVRTFDNWSGEFTQFRDAVGATLNGTETCIYNALGALSCAPFPTVGSGMAIPIRGVSDVVQVKHSCALRRDGRVICAANGSWLESEAMGLAPRLVEGLDNVVELSLGCVRRSDGTGWCRTAGTAFSQLPGITDAIDIDWACAVRSNGHVLSWPRMLPGGVFDAPVEPVRIDDALEVAAGGPDCVLRASGQILCAPPGLRGHWSAWYAPPTQAAAGSSHTCTRLSNGAVQCWGSNARGQLGLGASITVQSMPRSIPSLTDATSVSAGDAHTCARHATGQVSCWGENAAGQLGDGTTSARALPTRVMGLDDTLQVSAGHAHTCARRTRGDVVCWGEDAQGQLGDDDALRSRLAPVAVAGVDDALDLTVGARHACVRRASGVVSCWGDNTSGQLGDGTSAVRATPVTISGLSEVVEVSAGDAHTCARRANGQVFCWGSNDRGQLGTGTSAESATPVRVVGLDDAIAIGAGARHTCALREGRTVVCWGSNEFEQVGNAATGASSNVPVPISGLVGVRWIGVGGDHSCAMQGDFPRQLQCWGRDTQSQIDGTAGATRRDPTAIPGA